MTAFFVVLSHAVTIAGIAALGFGAYFAITESLSVHERIVRGIALVTGSFAYLAARALGVPLPTLMLNAVAEGKWISFIMVGVIVPTLAGFFLARYIIRCMQKNDDIAIRVMLLISTLVLVMFADIHVVAAGEAKFDDLRPLAPNVTFLLTMMAYVVFEYRPRDHSSRPDSDARARPDHRGPEILGAQTDQRFRNNTANATVPAPRPRATETAANPPDQRSAAMVCQDCAERGAKACRTPAGITMQLCDNCRPKWIPEEKVQM